MSEALEKAARAISKEFYRGAVLAPDESKHHSAFSAYSADDIARTAIRAYLSDPAWVEALSDAWKSGATGFLDNMSGNTIEAINRRMGEAGARAVIAKLLEGLEP